MTLIFDPEGQCHILFPMLVAYAGAHIKANTSWDIESLMPAPKMKCSLNCDNNHTSSLLDFPDSL